MSAKIPRKIVPGKEEIAGNQFAIFVHKKKTAKSKTLMIEQVIVIVLIFFSKLFT